MYARDWRLLSLVTYSLVNIQVGSLLLDKITGCFGSWFSSVENLLDEMGYLLSWHLCWQLPKQFKSLSIPSFMLGLINLLSILPVFFLNSPIFDVCDFFPDMMVNFQKKWNFQSQKFMIWSSCSLTIACLFSVVKFYPLFIFTVHNILNCVLLKFI